MGDQGIRGSGDHGIGGDLWRSSKSSAIFSNLQCSLATFGDLWQSLTTFSNLQLSSLIFGDLWRSLAIFGNIRQSLAIFCNLWRSLKIFSNLWRSSSSSDSYGNYWKCIEINRMGLRFLEIITGIYGDWNLGPT